MHQFDMLPASERDLWIADWESGRSMCPQCKGDVTVCSDHTRAWYPQRTICYPSMENAAANWRYDSLHKDLPFHDGDFQQWSANRTLDTPYHYRDGVNVWVSQHDLTPDDKFLGAVPVGGDLPEGDGDH